MVLPQTITENYLYPTDKLGKNTRKSNSYFYKVLSYMIKKNPITDWLPTTLSEVKKRGWDYLDVIIVTGDAYVDHPAFGHAVIGRLIESLGYKVAILAQPNWQDDLRDFRKLGEPRLFFAVSAGACDSMINHYTANKRLRSDDAYTPGGKSGYRPDNATVTYSQILKKLYPDTPVVIGGIEASLRRFTHYDYWEDKLRPSILLDSGADLLIYGMGEKPLTELLKLLERNIPFKSLQTICQSSFLLDSKERLKPNKKWDTLTLSSYDECLDDKELFAKNFKTVEKELCGSNQRRMVEAIGDKVVVINPPYRDVTSKDIDKSFDLPYTRLPHPKYKKRGDIPAYEMIKYSINIHRGCFGGCSFCAIFAHQGKKVISRSEKSILTEVENVKSMPGFKGYLSDLGGPSANMYGMKGKDSEKCESCQRPSCLFPNVCKNLDTSHKRLLELYEKVRKTSGIKQVSVTSGIRYDLFLPPRDESHHKHNQYFRDIVKFHISGRLKIAPEHTSQGVLRYMRKSSFDLFKLFKSKFERLCEKEHKNYQIIPYFISSHPGSKISDMHNLMEETRSLGFKLEQVQDFTPTPLTLSTTIYYTGIDPYNLKPVYCAKSKNEKLNQRLFFFWYKPGNEAKIAKLINRDKS